MDCLEKLAGWLLMELGKVEVAYQMRRLKVDVDEYDAHG
jgi:hypothetical protein